MTLTLIGELDYGATPSASDDFDITGVDEVVMICDGVTTAGGFGVRLSADGGGTFPSTSGDYLVSSWTANASSSDGAATLMPLSGIIAGGTGRDMVQVLSGLQGPHPAAGFATGAGVNITATNNFMGMTHLRTKNASVGPFNRLRVACPSGNNTAGTLRLYKRTGVLTLIGSLDYGSTPSASDDFALSGADDVLIIREGINPSGAWGVRLSDDNGSTFYSTSGNYIRTATGHSAAEVDTNTTMFRLGFYGSSGNHGIAQLLGLQAARPAHMINFGTEVAAVPGIQHDTTSASVVGPFTHIRLMDETAGNVTAGKAHVYKWT